MLSSTRSVRVHACRDAGCWQPGAADEAAAPGRRPGEEAASSGSTATARIDLGVIDQAIPWTAFVSLALIYASKRLDERLLAASLSRALAAAPAFAGRLRKDPATREHFVQLCDSGADLQLAASDTLTAAALVATTRPPPPQQQQQQQHQQHHQQQQQHGSAVGGRADGDSSGGGGGGGDSAADPAAAADGFCYSVDDGLLQPLWPEQPNGRLDIADLVDSPGAPLLRARATRLACGGTALAITLPHALADALTLRALLERWATEYSRLEAGCERCGSSSSLGGSGSGGGEGPEPPRTVQERLHEQERQEQMPMGRALLDAPALDVLRREEAAGRTPEPFNFNKPPPPPPGATTARLEQELQQAKREQQQQQMKQHGQQCGEPPPPPPVSPPQEARLAFYVPRSRAAQLKAWAMEEIAAEQEQQQRQRQQCRHQGVGNLSSGVAFVSTYDTLAARALQAAVAAHLRLEQKAHNAGGGVDQAGPGHDSGSAAAEGGGGGEDGGGEGGEVARPAVLVVGWVCCDLRGRLGLPPNGLGNLYWPQCTGLLQVPGVEWSRAPLAAAAAKATTAREAAARPARTGEGGGGAGGGGSWCGGLGALAAAVRRAVLAAPAQALTDLAWALQQRRDAGLGASEIAVGASGSELAAAFASALHAGVTVWELRAERLAFGRLDGGGGGGGGARAGEGGGGGSPGASAAPALPIYWEPRLEQTGVPLVLMVPAPPQQPQQRRQASAPGQEDGAGGGGEGGWVVQVQLPEAQILWLRGAWPAL